MLKKIEFDTIEGLIVLQMMELAARTNADFLYSEKKLAKKILDAWPDLREYGSVQELLSFLD